MSVYPARTETKESPFRFFGRRNIRQSQQKIRRNFKVIRDGDKIFTGQFACFFSHYAAQCAFVHTDSLRQLNLRDVSASAQVADSVHCISGKPFFLHAPEKIDGERHMQIDIYLKFIGNFQVPQDEPTAEEIAEEEKQKQRRAKNREKVARCMERKKLKDAQEKEDAAHENDSAV